MFPLGVSNRWSSGQGSIEDAQGLQLKSSAGATIEIWLKIKCERGHAALISPGSLPLPTKRRVLFKRHLSVFEGERVVND